MGRLSNNAEIIADLSALRLVTQEIVGLLLVAGGGKHDYLTKLRDGAHDRLISDEIVVPGFTERDIKVRAAATIDQLFDGVGRVLLGEHIEPHAPEAETPDPAPAKGSIIIETVDGARVPSRRAKWTFRPKT